jgi:arginyl-tRNA--protein-N-Asp/Glu arginylyltransferase
MQHSNISDPPIFFKTANLPCPYIDGQVERRVLTELVGRGAIALHDQLSLAGFRRSHSIAYAPACPFCQACMAVRIVVDEFKMSKSQRRIWNKNSDLICEIVPAVATSEQFDLFDRYQKKRHAGGGMAKMDFFEFQNLVEETPVDTSVVEFRDADNRLIGAILTDNLKSGVSAVYSFFDPDEDKRSLGSEMLLWLIDYAKMRSFDYIYLGYWVKGSPKMSYKAKFTPLEVCTASGWESFETIDE